MARPLSDEKRRAILNAAAEVFAERGIGAPTAAISKVAGVAEGSLFTYFATKDDLMNALYREIKHEVAESLMLKFPREQDVRIRMLHVWDAYVHWATRHPHRSKVLRQLQVSGRLTKESETAGAAPFVEVMETAKEAIASGALRDVPLDFLASMMDAQMEATISFMAAHPKAAGRYRALGFELLWNGLNAQ